MSGMSTAALNHTAGVMSLAWLRGESVSEPPLLLLPPLSLLPLPFPFTGRDVMSYISLLIFCLDVGTYVKELKVPRRRERERQNCMCYVMFFSFQLCKFGQDVRVAMS